MNRKHSLWLIACGLIAISVGSCSSKESGQNEFALDLEGAAAVGLLDIGPGLATTTGGCNLVVFDSAGNELADRCLSSPEFLVATEIDAFSAGFIVIDDLMFHLFYNSGTQRSYPRAEGYISGVRVFMGENSQGDLIFQDGTIVREGGLTVDKIGADPADGLFYGFERVTRDYASAVTATTNATFARVINTVTGDEQEYLDGCGFSAIEAVALSDRQVLVTGCHDPAAFIDMTDGSTTATELSAAIVSPDILIVDDGAVFLSFTGCPDTSESFSLCHVDVNGNATTVVEGGFTFPEGAFSARNENFALRGATTNYYVILDESQQLELIHRESYVRSTPLGDKQITAVSVVDDLIYYAGSSVVGVYDVDSEEDFKFPSERTLATIVGLQRTL